MRTPAVVVAGRTIVGASTRTVGDEGHEVLTRDAVGPTRVISFTVGGVPTSHTLTATDLADIILGNRSVDLGTNDADDSGAGIPAATQAAEQRRHALRTTEAQATAAALGDIRSEFARVHALILREPNPRRRLRLIGVNLHLIQDSYSPAHSERDFARGGCYLRVRHYGARIPGTGGPHEHEFPADSRDSVTAPAARTARAHATDKSRRYLQIVLKALRGGPAGLEAAAELTPFIVDVFRPC